MVFYKLNGTVIITARMKEKFESIVPYPQVEKERNTHKPTLRESLVGNKGKLSKELTSVARMLNYLDLTLPQKRQLFFYHLWHETNSFIPIKQFIEINEDPYNYLIDPVLTNDKLVEAYEDFYSRYEVKTRTKTRFQEKIEEILPLRGLYSTDVISKKTGYSQNYIRSVFKRALKKELIKPLDKKEIAKRDIRYGHYRILGNKVAGLRNSDEHRYTEREIADILTEDLRQVVSIQQVKRQIRLLLRDGRIEKRVNQVR